jgi:transposase
VLCASCPATEELAAKDASLVALQEENDVLRAKVAALAEIAFGGSERRGGAGRDEDRDLDDLDDDCSAGEGDAGEPPGPAPGNDGEAGGTRGGTRRRGQRHGAPGHGRRRYDHLEVEVVVHELNEDERCCASCGKAYEPIAGDEVSSEISWRVVVYRIEHRRRRYRRSCDCAGSGMIKVTPAPAKVIPKGLFSALAIASVLVDKFALARPINKVVASLQMNGLEVSPGSLAGVLATVNTLLVPLQSGIAERARSASWWHCDETSWACFLDPDAPERPDGRRRRWWLWVAKASDATIFVAAPSRAAKILEALLGSADEATSGIVCSDMYAAYGCLDQLRFVHAWCWAHVRRHIMRAAASLKALGPWRDAWLTDIAAMYAAWHARRAGTDDGSGLLSAIGAIRARLDAQVAGLESQVPRAAKVITMIDSHWDGLVTFASHEEIAPDNNAAERVLRPEVLLRKNCGGSGAPWAAELAANAFSVIATAKQWDLSPLSYLHAYLSACAEAGGKAPRSIDRFLPWSASAEDLAAWRAPPP